MVIALAYFLIKKESRMTFIPKTPKVSTHKAYILYKLLRGHCIKNKEMWNQIDTCYSASRISEFPYELNKKQREQMLTDLCQRIVARHRVIVDACIHAPHVENGTTGTTSSS